ALHPRTAAHLAALVRIMNTYYSNLIEGHDTRPRDIEPALAGRAWRLNGDLERKLSRQATVERRGPQTGRAAIPPFSRPRQTDMNAPVDPVAPRTAGHRYLAETHEVVNVGSELAGYDMYRQNPALVEAVHR